MNIFMKKTNMLKKLGLVMACCVAISSTPSVVNAAATNTVTGSMTTVSGIPVSLRLSSQSAALTHISTSSSSVSHTQDVTCNVVFIGTGGKTKSETVKYTCSGYDKTIGATVKVSAFTSGGYTGFYYKGTAKTTFSAIKIPEAKSVSKTLSVSVPADTV